MLIRASISQSGFVPGQVVPVVVEISNQSKVQVEEIRFSLRKIIHYNSQSPTSKTLEEIETVCEQRVGGLEQKELSQLKQDLNIPAVPPTIGHLCRVININYEIKVEVKVGKAHLNPVVRMPITIGTVPLFNYPDGSLHSAQMPIMTVQNASAPNAPVAIDGDEPEIHTIRSSRPEHELRKYQCLLILGADKLTILLTAPPSYEEALGAVDINDAEEDSHPIASQPYAPRYPVYHANTLIPALPATLPGSELGRTNTGFIP